MDSLLEHEDDILRPPWGPLGRDAVLGMVAGFSKLLLNVLNTTQCEAPQLERLMDHVIHRAPGQGLLTYCNHTRCRWFTAQLLHTTRVGA